MKKDSSLIIIHRRGKVKEKPSNLPEKPPFPKNPLKKDTPFSK